MISVSVNGDVKDIVRDLKLRQPQIVKRSTLTALNRANAKVFTEAKREVRKRTGVPLKHYKSKIRKYNARFNNLRARVWMGLGARIRLAAVNTGKKINRKWEPLIDAASLEDKTLANAFRATMPNGSDGIFIRRRNAGAKGGRDSKGQLKRNRLPIRAVTLDITKESSEAVIHAGNVYGRAEFERVFKREFERRQASTSVS